VISTTSRFFRKPNISAIVRRLSSLYIEVIGYIIYLRKPKLKHFEDFLYENQLFISGSSCMKEE
jgi:hypothetical protein